MSKSIVGNYSGQVQFAEGYRTDGKFYEITEGLESNLEGVTSCTNLTLKIQEQKCSLIWGVYEYYNPIEKEMDIDNFSGVRIGENVWQLIDSGSGDEIITLTFHDNHKKASFSLVAGADSAHVLKEGFFEMMDGVLKRTSKRCC